MYNKPAGDAAIYIIEWIFGLCLRSWVCLFLGFPSWSWCTVAVFVYVLFIHLRTDTGYHPLGNLPPFRLYRAKELGFRVDP